MIILLGIRQIADIKLGKNGSIEKRVKQWADGTEHYELEENAGKVKLTITQDVPNELVEYFEKKLPEVLKRVKILAEKENECA